MDTICLNCGWTFPPREYRAHQRACLDGASTADEKMRRLAGLLAAEFHDAMPRDEAHYRRTRLLVLRTRSVLDAVEREAESIFHPQMSSGPACG